MTEMKAEEIKQIRVLYKQKDKEIEELKKQLGDVSHQIFMYQQEFLLHQKYAEQFMEELNIELVKITSGILELLNKKQPIDPVEHKQKSLSRRWKPNSY